MPKKKTVKLFLATIKDSTSATSRRAVTPSSSQTSTSPSAYLLSCLDHTDPKEKSQSSTSASSPANFAANVLRDLSPPMPDGENAVESTSNSSPEFAYQTLVNSLLDIEYNHNSSSVQDTLRKAMTGEKDQSYLFRNTKSGRYTKLMNLYAKLLGPGSTIRVFADFGIYSSTEEYNALIGLCIHEARMNRDKDEAFDYIGGACELLLLIKKKGLEIKEASYGPILSYLVDFKMVQEFGELRGFLKEENPSALSRLGYYEMLLCLRVSDEQRISEICKSIVMKSDDDAYSLRESYLLAFCETDRDKDLSMLLNVLDINKVSKPCYVVSIFKSLGRLQLENFSEKFLSDISKAGVESKRFSALIYEYTTNLPNLQAKEMVFRFASLHEKFEAIPLYDLLITYFCNLNLIDEALFIVNYMCKSGLNVSIEAFDPILLACDQNRQPYMVRSIYSLMREHNLRPKGETFKTLISLFVQMKDFEGACEMLEEVKTVGETPTASMYNVIIGGYFREKKSGGMRTVLNQMKNHGVKPDADTFRYLIFNSDSEKDISKYREELRQAGLQITQSVCIGLVQAYSKLGNFHMAKQVVEDPEVPLKYIAGIKSALISSLSSHGEISEAIKIYEELKQENFQPAPKAVICLIEHIKTEGEMERITEMLKGLKDSKEWWDACCRVILYCVQHNYIDDAIGLLKELRDKNETDAYMCVDQIFNHAHKESIKLETCMQLLRALKEELGFQVPRTSLDFLLSMCFEARDLRTAKIVWNEYKLANLPYNVLTKIRMFKAFWVSGEFDGAKELLKEICQRDEHVRLLIKYTIRHGYNP